MFNTRINRFEETVGAKTTLGLINRKHDLKLLSSKIVNTIPVNHPLLLDLSFTSSEIDLLKEYCPEENILFTPVGKNVSSNLPTVLVEGNIGDFFGAIGRLRGTSLQGKFDQLIVQRGVSSDLIAFVEKSKDLLVTLQSKIRDEIEYQMDIYIYKKIDPFHGGIYNEKLKYSISFTEDEESFLRKEVGVWYISNPQKATPPLLDLEDSMKKVPSGADTRFETTKETGTTTDIPPLPWWIATPVKREILPTPGPRAPPRPRAPPPPLGRKPAGPPPGPPPGRKATPFIPDYLDEKATSNPFVATPPLERDSFSSSFKSMKNDENDNLIDFNNLDWTNATSNPFVATSPPL